MPLHIISVEGYRASLVLVILFIVVLTVAIWQKRSSKTKLPLPPKPPGRPIVGNLPEFIAAAKKGQQHLLVDDWVRQYGDLIRVQLGPVTEYFVSSDIGVKEIFDRASAQTAERPRWIVSNEHICNKLNVLLLNGSDPRWKHQRRMIHSALTSVPRADAGLPFLNYETAKFLHEVAHDPNTGTASQSSSLWPSIGRYTNSTFAMQTYGMEIPDTDSPVHHYIHETGLAQILATLPGAHLVDIMPWLDKLPLFLKPWERQARARFARDWNWTCERLKRVKNDIANGFSHDAFLPTVVNDEKLLGFLSEEEAAYLSLQLIIGAADTSRLSTWSFLEAMMMYPEVQEKARKLIDDHVGDRLPVFADLERIPYVRCLMKEVWRWRPPVALGHPHATTRELAYKGYRIPVGSRLHINAWAIGHDPQRHEDPDRFWPERYADDHTTTMQSINSSDPRQRDHFAFGSGRRVCPGYHVAERSLAVSIMRILWAFDIAPVPGTKLPLDPRDYPAEMPGNPGTSMPVTLKVRIDHKKRIIDEAYEAECKAHIPMRNLA